MRVLQIRRAVDEVAQGLALVEILAPCRDEALRDGRRGGRGARDFDLYGRMQEGVCETLDLGRHGGGEKQRLAGERHHLHDALDIGDEAHVEHPVGFVDDEKLDAAQQQLAALDMVEQPARCRDEHVDAARDLGILVAEGDAADQQGDVELVIDAVLVEVFLQPARRVRASARG